MGEAGEVMERANNIPGKKMVLQERIMITKVVYGCELSVQELFGLMHLRNICGRRRSDGVRNT